MASRWTSPHFVASLIVPMVAAVVLFAVALPRLSAAVAELPARPAIEKIHSGEHISMRALESAEKSLSAANRSSDDAERWSTVGLLRYLQAREQSDDNERRHSLLEASSAASRSAVSLNPAKGYAWLRLAQSELALHGVSEPVVHALDMALRTLPANRGSVIGLVEMTLIAWPAMSEASRDRARAQFSYAVTVHPTRLVEVAEKRLASPIVRAALRRSPELLDLFDTRRQQLRRN